MQNYLEDEKSDDPEPKPQWFDKYHQMEYPPGGGGSPTNQALQEVPEV